MDDTNQVQPVVLRFNRQAYLKLRHRLVDKQMSVNQFFNEMLVKYIAQSESEKRESA